MKLKEAYDVVVVGAGNAGLCSAISAAQKGKRVLVIEKAPRIYRGGNSSLTMNFRFPHNNFEELLSLIDDGDRNLEVEKVLRESYMPYTKDDFLHDLRSTSNNQGVLDLQETLVDKSFETILWMRDLGHKWTYKDFGNIFKRSIPLKIKGSGKSLQERNFNIAESLGVDVMYCTSLYDFVMVDNCVKELILTKDNGESFGLPTNSLILALGGYEANPYFRQKFLGESWENVGIRGVPFNTGDWFFPAIKNNIQLYGDYSEFGCHATPQSSYLPDYLLPGENIKSQNQSRYQFNLGITINHDGKRFFDEGESMPNFLYAKVGRMINKQINNMAFQIFDRKTVGFLSQSYFSDENLFSSNSLRVICEKFGINHRNLHDTIESYNRNCVDNAICDFSYLDGNKSVDCFGVPKSNWAQKIDTPPYYIAPVKAGVTFTYGGLKVRPDARVYRTNGECIDNMFACGEIVGGVHYGNYAGGTGLMLGAVFGRIAGENA